MAVFLPGIPILFRMKKGKGQDTHPEAVSFLEAPPYGTKLYGHHSCGGSTLAEHIATPNKIAFLSITKKHRLDLGRTTNDSLRLPEHYPRSSQQNYKAVTAISPFYTSGNQGILFYAF